MHASIPLLTGGNAIARRGGGRSDYSLIPLRNHKLCPLLWCKPIQMTRFYFHVRQGETLIEDRKGEEMPDLLAAWNHAMVSARSLIDSDAMSGSIDDQWVEIATADGSQVASMPFRRCMHLN